MQPRESARIEICEQAREDTSAGEAGAMIGVPDQVERAIADALARASAAGAWDAVATLARELEARRKARQSPTVVSIEAARAKRRS